MDAAAQLRTAEGAARYSLPFAHLNLRFNPFGELPLELRAELAIVDVASLVEQLRERKFVVQFMGDKGRGKTTHLLALKQHFPSAAYVHIPEDDMPPIPEGDPLMIDEVQRLPYWKRRRIFRRDVPLVLGTHQDFERPLRRAGRRVVSVDVGLALTAQRLADLLARRIEFARRAAGPLPQLTPASINSMLAAHGSDVRAIEGHLYHVFQNLKEPGRVEV